MNPIPIFLIIGAALGVLFILITRRLFDPEGEMRIYAIGLVVAAAIYVAFQIYFTIQGAPLMRLGIEVVGLGGFFTIAILRHTESNMILSGGWTAHAVWDIFLHAFSPTSQVADWYPVGCIAFDFVVAGYIFLKLRETDPSLEA